VSLCHVVLSVVMLVGIVLSSIGRLDFRLLLFVFRNREYCTYLGSVWLHTLKFNKHGSTFVLFDKKFLILD
jgi:hypothetical protein